MDLYFDQGKTQVWYIPYLNLIVLKNGYWLETEVNEDCALFSTVDPREDGWVLLGNL